MVGRRALSNLIAPQPYFFFFQIYFYNFAFTLLLLASAASTVLSCTPLARSTSAVCSPNDGTGPLGPAFPMEKSSGVRTELISSTLLAGVQASCNEMYQMEVNHISQMQRTHTRHVGSVLENAHTDTRAHGGGGIIDFRKVLFAHPALLSAAESGMATMPSTACTCSSAITSSALFDR